MLPGSAKLSKEEKKDELQAAEGVASSAKRYNLVYDQQITLIDDLGVPMAHGYVVEPEPEAVESEDSDIRGSLNTRFNIAKPKDAHS